LTKNIIFLAGFNTIY